ncbi:MAG: HD domain-containing protein [Candidatus Rokubacteria bacterium]|nr:HD domain-containing protein [Candidatus Rokubacteria bacterium]
MAGHKGFRNLPKLERVKRGRPAPGPPPSPRGAGRQPRPRPAAGPRVLTLADFPSAHQTVLITLADLLRPSQEAFLVGGAVRDLLLSRQSVEDLDLAVPSGALRLAQALARRLGGTFVALDAERGSARVVVEAGEYQVDLTDFRAPTLEADLRGRDFSVNAIAVPLVPLVREGKAPLLDPVGGMRDLAGRRLHLSSPGAFDEDPVRAFRGVRLATELGFALDSEAKRSAQRVAPRLPAMAPERVREELARLLRLPRASRGLRELDRLGLLEAIVSEIGPMKSTTQPKPHRFSVWEHSLRTVEAVDLLLLKLSSLSPYAEELAAHMAEPLGDGLTRGAVLKLAGLLHDVAKPQTRGVIEGRVRFIGHDVEGAATARAIGQRLRLSGRAVDVLERLVRHHLRPMHLGQVAQITRRARYRFFRDLGREARDLLLLTLADAAAVRGESPIGIWRGPGGRLVADLLRGWEEDRVQAAAPPFVRGEDVMAACGLPPGPEVGRLLALAREAQDLGVVTTREEALAYLRRVRETPDRGLDTQRGPQ